MTSPWTRSTGHDAGDIQLDGSAIGPARVHGDPRLLGQVVRNLVDNAVRHARSRVSVSLAARGSTVELIVDDDGHGIAARDVARVFDRFVRLDEARARDEGGAGLGLAIVREIVDLHDGTVTVGEAPDGGARFTVVLPANLNAASGSFRWASGLVSNHGPHGPRSRPDR